MSIPFGRGRVKLRSGGVIPPEPIPDVTTPVLAHYYAWYGTNGVDGHNALDSPYTPVLGSYESNSSVTLEYHLAWAQYAHIDGFIQDWWDIGIDGDDTMASYLAYTATNYPAFKWSLHYEPEGYANPTVAAIRADLAHLQQYFAHPNWLKSSDGRPVMFVYESGGQDQDMLDRWRSAIDLEDVAGNPIFYLMPSFTNFRNLPNQPDGWHSYVVPEAGVVGILPWSVTIQPGVWTYPDPEATFVRSPVTFQTNLELAIASSPTYIIINSFNENHEGSQVEPYEEETPVGQYITIMRDVLP